MTYRILLVDDNEMVKRTLDLIIKNEFEKNSVILDWVDSGEKAITEINKFPNVYSVVLMDFDLSSERKNTDGSEPINGVEAAQTILKRHPQIQIVMQSGDKTRDLVIKVMELGITTFIDKPLNPPELVKTLKSYFYRYDKHIRPYELSSEQKNERQQFIANISDGLVGRSEALFKICKRIESLADSDSRVLITGENGTGKELIARAIHKNSKRKDKSFVAVNVGALSTTLMESEMFGHEKGSFTGAIKRKEGRFLQASGGTLFLDEIGELPLELQAKLLRVLQENEVEPVGGEKPISIDTRVIAATNVDLKKAVEDGKFREDLYHRLKVVPLAIPALRDRKDDIPLLIEAGIKKFWSEEKSMKHSVFQTLVSYSWPGNVRELMNLMERFGSHPAIEIRMDHLDAQMIEEEMKSESTKVIEKELQIDSLEDIEKIRDNLERDFLIRELPKYGQSSIRTTADAMGVNYSYLQRAVKRLKIDFKKLVKPNPSNGQMA